jgi:hypothetical protein
MKKRYIPVQAVVSLLILLFAAETHASQSGSAYSRFGVGERWHFGSVRSIGLGGTAIGLRGPSHINYVNPASWSDLLVVQFNGSFYYENISSDDGSATGGISTGNINSALLSLPVKPSRGMTVSFGFAPMSRVGYDVQTQSPVDGGLRIINYTGTGGITNLMAGMSYRPHRDIALGAMALYRTGLLQYEWVSQYTVGGFGAGRTHRILDVNGIAGQAGVLYSGLLSPRREGEYGPLTIGAVFTTPTRLDANEKFIIQYAAAPEDTASDITGAIRIPHMIGAGVNYIVDRRNNLSFDVRYEPWDDFRKFGQSDARIRDSWRIGAGWERTGNPEPGSGFFDRTTFRLGLLYNASYFNIDNTPINESFVTAGMGIPVSGIAVLDIGAQIGVRGTTDNGLQRDTMYRIFISLSMFERWFIPPAIE